jgi:hypothetical protein
LLFDVEIMHVVFEHGGFTKGETVMNVRTGVGRRGAY